MERHMTEYGVWVEKEFEEQPVQIHQIDDIVYLHRNIRQEGDIWKAEERVVPIEIYRTEVELSASISSAQAEAIVISAEYASSLLGGV